MGWNTYIVNQTGRDVWCFWSTNPAITAGWDSTYGFQVPAGKSCSSNRGGLCLFGLGGDVRTLPPRAACWFAGQPVGGAEPCRVVCSVGWWWLHWHSPEWYSGRVG